MTRVAVISFPGSNCDRDIITAVEMITRRRPTLVWHKESDITDHDLMIIPGGFSFGDYLRCGAIAAKSPAMDDLLRHASRGGYVLGICNGFQILTETELLPGTLIRNIGLKFTCREVSIACHNTNRPLLNGLEDGQFLRMPVAHNEGNFFADEETLSQIADKGQIAFTYADTGETKQYNPNGSINDIAGIMSENGRVIGLMPHPERMVEPIHHGTDGGLLLKTVIEAAA